MFEVRVITIITHISIKKSNLELSFIKLTFLANNFLAKN